MESKSEEAKKGQQIPYKDMIEGGVKIFEQGYNISKGKEVEKNIGSLLATAGGIAMAFGGPVGLIAGGILCASGGIMAVMAPKAPTEVEILKKQVVALLSHISKKMDIQHKETMDKLEDINKLMFKGFLEVKHSLIDIEERVKEIQGHMLKDWNTSELHKFQAYFKTFFEKRYVEGEQEAYDYLKKNDPYTFKNMLKPEQLEAWLGELCRMKLSFRMKFLAVQDFLRYRWMTFILIFYLSMYKQSKTTVDPVVYACQTLKDDVTQYYRLSQKYLRYKINRMLVGRSHSYEAEDVIDHRKFIEDKGENFEHYQISKIKVNCCFDSKFYEKNYKVVGIQTTFQHRAYLTTIETPLYGQQACGCKHEKPHYSFDFKPEEYIIKIHPEDDFKFITNCDQVFPDGTKPYVWNVDKEVIGFVFLPGDYGHLSIVQLYTHEPRLVEVPIVTNKEYPQKIEYDFKADPWDEKDRVADKLLDAGMQEYFIMFVFDPQKSFFTWQSLKSLRDVTANLQLQRLDIVTPLYNTYQLDEWVNSFSTNRKLRHLRFKFINCDLFKYYISVFERIGTSYPGLKEIKIQNEIYTPLTKKYLPDLAKCVGLVLQQLEDFSVTLYLKDFNVEDLHSIYEAFKNTKATYLSLCLLHPIKELNVKEEEKILKTLCTNVSDPSLQLIQN